jgi:hypothetical protein
MHTVAIERSTLVDAPTPTAWAVVGDLDGYHRHAAGLRETTVMTGSGQGARRRCVDSSGRSWEESCVVWQPEQRYVIDVDVSTHTVGYRALFSSFRGTWSVRAVGDQSEVTIRFDAVLRRVPGIKVLAARLAQQAGSDVEAILSSYAETAGRKSRAGRRLADR